MEEQNPRLTTSSFFCSSAAYHQDFERYSFLAGDQCAEAYLSMETLSMFENLQILICIPPNTESCNNKPNKSYSFCQKLFKDRSKHFLHATRRKQHCVASPWKFQGTRNRPCNCLQTRTKENILSQIVWSLKLDAEPFLYNCFVIIGSENGSSKTKASLQWSATGNIALLLSCW